MKNSDDLLEISSKTLEPHIIIKTTNWSFLFKGRSILPAEHVQYNDGFHDYFFIGEVYNVTELRILLAKYSSNALTCGIPELLYLLYVFQGKQAFSLVDGPFTFIKCGDKELTVLTDALGCLPVNVLFSSSIWVTSELKMIAKTKAVQFDFITPEQLIAIKDKSDDFLPIKNARKIKPGQELTIHWDGRNHPYVNTVDLCTLALGTDQKVDVIEASAIVFQLIDNSLHHCIQNESHISLPLSGGIDSSLIAALMTNKVEHLTTYSIGSEENNEFAYSKIVANHLNTTHQEFILSNDDIMRGIIEAVYYNELFDGLSAEIQSGLFNLYRLDAGKSSAMVTGYGADLIFGGVLDHTCSIEQVNKLLWEQIYRTRWTGEFSNFGALHYGIKIKHPFWNLKLISYCLNLDPSLKLARGEVKVFIRDHLHRQQLLPDTITWRKKIGIHEGSSKNKIFAQLIGVDTANYEAKTLFSYELYKRFLTENLTPELFNISDFRELVA